MATALPSNPATALDKTDEHSTTALYRAAIGDVSNGYYLPRFVRFEAADRPGLSWNWAAAFNTLNWLMFRQLWQAALAYSGSIVAAALLGLGIGKLVFQFSDGLQWGLLAAIVGLTVVVPGLGGNALYFLATRDRVQKALAKHRSVAEACIDLHEKSSTRRGLIVIAIGNAVALGIALQSYAMFTGFEPLPFGSPVGTPPSAPAADAAKLGLNATPAAGEGRNVASGKIESGDAAPAAVPAPPAGAATSTAPATSPTPEAPAMSVAPTPTPTPAPAPPPASAPPMSGNTEKPAGPAAPKPTVSKPADSKPADSKATTTKPVAAAPVPMPVPMRSAAADAAAREVAAAMGQTLPVQPTPTGSTSPTAANAPATPTTPVTPSSPAPRSTPATAAPAEKAQASRFVVNVGLFSDANAARNALVKLSDADIPVIRREVRAASGNRTLLQAGPYDTVAEADAAAAKMRALGIEGRVATLP